MTKRMVSVCKCDSCGTTEEYRGLGAAPNGWAIPNIQHNDDEGATLLHVCPECVSKALDEWLPNNTWCGSTDNWR